MEEEEVSYEKSPRPEDLVPDEDGRYESEEEIVEAKIKEKPVGPPMELEIPLRPPPARSEKVHLCYFLLCNDIYTVFASPFKWTFLIYIVFHSTISVYETIWRLNFRCLRVKELCYSIYGYLLQCICPIESVF